MLTLLFSWCKNIMSEGGMFKLVDDPFCQAVLAYAQNSHAAHRRQHLHEVMSSLLPEAFQSQAEETHDTRLFYLIKCFLFAGILEFNIPMVHLFLSLSRSASNQLEYDMHPLVFQLFTEDVHGKNVHGVAHEVAAPRFLTLINTTCDALMQQGFLTPGMTYITAGQELLQLHLDVLQSEFDNKKIDAATHASERAMLLDRSAHCMDLCWLYTYENKEGANLLNRLLLSELNVSNFTRAYDLLQQARRLGWIAPEIYMHCLVQANGKPHGLLHALMYRGHKSVTQLGHVFYLEKYLHAIEALRAENMLPHQAYVELFVQKNQGGFSVMQQAMNAINIEVTFTFMAWFNKTPYFSASEKYVLLSHNGLSIDASPGIKRVMQGGDEHQISKQYSVQEWIDSHRAALKKVLTQDATPKVCERGALGFYSLTVDVFSQALEDDEASQRDFSSWTPSSFSPSTGSSSQRSGTPGGAFSPAASI